MIPELYNKIRRILFSTVHNPSKGFPLAFDYLENYRNKLGPMSYAGLKAELCFYQRLGKDLHLTVAGDMGDHADFSGVIDGNPVRIDVTTNINYKEFKTYEPFLGDGYNYKIAFMDNTNFEIVDVLDLAFPKCEYCKDSHVFPFVLMLNQEYSRKGNPTYLNDQVLIECCPFCENYSEIKRYSHYGLSSPSEFANEIPYDYDDNDWQIQEYRNYLNEQYQFLKKLFAVELMGICENSYEMIDKNGDGFWGITFPLCNNIVKNKIPKIIATGIIE